MRKLYFSGNLLVLVVIAVIVSGGGAARAEEITLTTYYPAPFGVYDQMVTDTLGVGDNDGVAGLTGDDAPTTSGDVWIAGNVGIGTTSPISKLHIQGGNFIMKSPGGRIRMGVWGGDSDSQHGQLRLYDNGGNERIRLYSSGNSYFTSGNIGIGTTSPNVKLDVIGDIELTGVISKGSDIRLKENIQPIDGALDKLLTLQGISFNMKGEDRRNLGIIAQEVQKVFPEAVSVIDFENNYLGLDYTQLVPVLIEAVKEQQRTISALEQRLAALEKEI